MKHYIIERREKIIEILEKDSIVTKNELAEIVYVQPKTIERDIKVLIKMGYNIISKIGRNGGYILQQ